MRRQSEAFPVFKPCFFFSRFLGYDRGEHGELVINEEEAATIEIIYAEFLAGLGKPGFLRHRLRQG